MHSPGLHRITTAGYSPRGTYSDGPPDVRSTSSSQYACTLERIVSNTFSVRIASRRPADLQCEHLRSPDIPSPDPPQVPGP